METRNYYVEGTTVRELAPERAPKRAPQRNPREIERQRKLKNRRNAVRRNRERELSMNLGFVTFLCVCVIIGVFACAYLVKMQSTVTQNLNKIAALEAEVTDLRTTNDETAKRLEASVDLNQIKETAINELGMTYPTEDQIIYYHVDKTNFMDQYGDVSE